MALSLLLRSSSRLTPVLMNASRIGAVPATASPILANKIAAITNSRQISVTPIRQSASGSHVALWQAERVLSVGLLGIVPVAFLVDSQASEYLLSLALVMHFHWGLEALVTDYVRENMFGAAFPKVAHGLLILVSAATLAGLFMMAYKDQGLAKTTRKIWTIQPAK